MEANPARFKEKILAEQINLLFTSLILSVPASLLCSLITFIALYRIPHTALLIFWFTATIVLSIFRLGLAGSYLKDRKSNPSRLYIFLASTFLAAGLWGFAAFALMPPDHLMEQMIVIVVIAGVTAGGVQSLKASLSASLIFIYLILTPLCAWIFLQNNISSTILGFSMTVYLLFLTMISFRGVKFLEQTLQLKYENLDLTEKIQNEKEFLNTMLDNLQEGIIACDSNYKITVFNDALQKKLGISNAEAECLSADFSNYFDLYLVTDHKEIKVNEFPLRRTINGENIHAMEFIIRFKNNSSINVIINGQPIINASGDKLGAVITIHDVTEIKKSEKIKNEFVSVVSHELRTPLTSIQGSLDLLIGGMGAMFPDKAKKLLHIASKNCTRLLLLINDILDIEKLQVGKMKFSFKVVSINKIVEEAIVNNRMYAEKYGVTFAVQMHNKDPQVYVDPHRLSQVLANLISNAVKFSPRGGIIQLKIESYQDNVRVSVTDQGPGIPSEFQSRIFQKFAQADSTDARSHQGTGLGLSISKDIIEKLGGSLNFVSKPNEGATFFFDLPFQHNGRENPDDSQRQTKESVSDA